MKKLKNTTQNKLIVSGSLLILGSAAGYLLAGKDSSMKKPFAIIGAVVGMASSSFAISMLLEKPKEED